MIYSTFFSKFKNKKFVIGIIMISIATVFVVAVYWGFNLNFFRGPSLNLTDDYDIQRDYCGKIVDLHYCKCAFDGEFCDVIDSGDKDVAYKLIMAGFERWVVEKKKTECAEKGGLWKDDDCG